MTTRMELSQLELRWLQDGLSHIIEQEIGVLRTSVMNEETDDQLLIIIKLIAHMHALKVRLNTQIDNIDPFGDGGNSS